MVRLMTSVVPLFVPGSRERFARIDGEMVDRPERPVAAACYLLHDFLC